MEKDIVIIGAGAAGIAAARRLTELQRDFLLIEASGETGGRCRTDSVTLGWPVDLGAHWLHSPGLNPMLDIARSFGIRIGAELEGRYTRNGGWLDEAEAGACTSYIESCFERVSVAAEDCAVATLFPDPASPWHAAFEAEFRAKQGLAPEASSARDFARYVWEGSDLPVLDGYGTRLARLAEGLPLHTAAPVSRVDWSSGQGIAVETALGTVRASRVILTVSTAALGRIRFDPPLPDWKQEAVAALPMGHCNKIALRFTRPVFGDLAPSLIVPLRGAEESVELVVREDGKDCVTCLVNGTFARDIAAAGPTAMQDYALQRLAEIFGTKLRRDVAEEVVFANWDADPFIGGCYTVAKPGAAHRRQDLARPVEGRVFFAGEATSPHFMGDVHGAWFSGIDAADAAIAQ